MQELISNGYGSDASSEESPEPSSNLHASVTSLASSHGDNQKKRPHRVLPTAEALFNAIDHPASMDSLLASTSGQHAEGEVPEWKKPRHDGRVLSFAPSLGAHAILIFIPVVLPRSLVVELSSLISSLRGRGFKLHPLIMDLEPDESLRENPLASSHPMQTLHISLSRTQSVKFHLFESILRELKSSISKVASGMTCQSPLRVSLFSTTSFVNEDKTCSFASISVMDLDGSRDLIFSIIVAVNQVMVMHGLQTYYRTPQLHVSFAWAAGDHKEELGAALREGLSITPASVSIESIVCRIGKIDHQLL